MKSCALVLMIACVSTQGCNSWKIIGDPQQISIQDAMRDVGEGLALMHEKLEEKNLKFGLLPSEVDITFNISAKSTDNQKAGLVVDAGSNMADTISITKANASAGIDSQVIAERGNQITIRFRNIMTLDPTKTIAGAKDIKHIEGLRSQFLPTSPQPTQILAPGNWNIMIPQLDTKPTTKFPNKWIIMQREDGALELIESKV